MVRVKIKSTFSILMRLLLMFCGMLHITLGVCVISRGYKCLKKYRENRYICGSSHRQQLLLLKFKEAQARTGGHRNVCIVWPAPASARGGQSDHCDVTCHPYWPLLAATTAMRRIARSWASVRALAAAGRRATCLQSAHIIYKILFQLIRKIIT